MDVRVGDEYRLPHSWGMFVVGSFDRTGVAVAADTSTGHCARNTKDWLTEHCELLWALPRKGDVWLNGRGTRYVLSTVNRAAVTGVAVEKWSMQLLDTSNDAAKPCEFMTPAEYRAQGWRPAPRSPKPLIRDAVKAAVTSVKSEYERIVGEPLRLPLPGVVVTSIPITPNPEPQVGETWQHDGWTKPETISRIDGDNVHFVGVSGWWSLSWMIRTEYWRRVSAAPAKSTIDPADAAAHPERYRWRARSGTVMHGIMCDDVWTAEPHAGTPDGSCWILRTESRPGVALPVAKQCFFDCDPLPLEDAPPLAADRALTEYARGYGLDRQQGETDAALRERLAQHAKRSMGVAAHLLNGPPQPPKPPPTWREIFHEVAANPPRYGRETWGKRAVKELWEQAASAAREAFVLSPPRWMATAKTRRRKPSDLLGEQPSPGFTAREAVAELVDAEYRRLGGEVW